MQGFFKLLLLLLLAPAIYAFPYEAVSFLLVQGEFLLTSWFLAGFVAYLALYVLFLKRRMAFFEIFEHELGHTVAAYVFMRSVESFKVELGKGGKVEYNRQSNFMITLAPYFLPVFTLPLLIIKPFLLPTTYRILDFFKGSRAFCGGFLQRFRPTTVARSIGWLRQSRCTFLNARGS